MTEEEKKAIEDIRWNNEHLYCDKKDVDYMLNLIQKQDTEINKLNNVIDRIINVMIGDKVILATVCSRTIHKTEAECYKQNLLCDDCVKEYFMKEDCIEK